MTLKKNGNGRGRQNGRGDRRMGVPKVNKLMVGTVVSNKRQKEKHRAAIAV